MADTPESYQLKDLQLPTWSMTGNPCAEFDANYAAANAAEALEVAGAPVNIFPLLGIHNQGSTVDLTGEGWALSSGTPAGFDASSAFNNDGLVWRSVQTGFDVVSSPAFIGYDFGTVRNKLNTGDRYSSHATTKLHITTIRIKQSADPEMRVTQVRVERSDDGVNWVRADVVNVPNTDQLETIGLRQSAPSNKWRLIPVMFSGVAVGKPWEVEEVEMLEMTTTSLTTIQDATLLENRDRQYSQISTMIKAHYDLLDVQSELSRFGIDIPQQYIFTVSYDVMVKKLGRPVVIGDILELPSEKQYDYNLHAVKKWLEVTDAGWSTDGYTPNWQPILFRFYAQPMNSTMENRDLIQGVGDLSDITDSQFMMDDFPIEISTTRTMEVNSKEALAAVPLTGADNTDFQETSILVTLPDAAGNTITKEIPIVAPTDVYTEDGLPPNNLPYTEGLNYPANPKDGDYHRLVYEASYQIPPRLFQWSMRKNKWIFKEQDKRQLYSSHKPSMRKILSSGNKKDLNE